MSENKKEEVKKKLLRYLKRNKGKGFSVLSLSKSLNIPYVTMLKWVTVFSVEGVVKVKDYGNVKLVYHKD